jgi:RNA polymerase sigma-70 factor (ECF subfamily)
VGETRLRDRKADADLVAAACTGDKGAFVELLTRHRTAAVALAGRMVGAEVASDAVQEATVLAMVSLERLRTPDRFGAWLCGITLNVARRWIREVRRLPPCVPDCGGAPTGPEELAEEHEMNRRVQAAVSTLAEGQRQAVLLFYWQGLSHAEVAAELDISIGAVKARLHQARNALRPRLAAVIETEEVAVMSVAPSPQWVDASIAGVRRAASEDPIRRVHVVLVEAGDTNQSLPIYVGAAEAIALAVNLEAVEMPRPMTYQFAANLLTATGTNVTDVRITRLVEDTFYAVVIVDGPGGPREVDARPSDGLNLAVVTGAPIRVDRSLLEDQAAIGRTEWQDYPTSTSAIVAEARERHEATLAMFRRQREEGSTG